MNRSLPLLAALALGSAAELGSAQTSFRVQKRIVVERTSFGANPDHLATIQTQADVIQYLRDQFNAPTTGYGGVADTLIQGANFLNEGAGLTYVPTHNWTRQDLQAKQIILALHSPYQLREVMAWFWDNHFSTYINQVRGVASVTQSQHPMSAEQVAVYQEWAENQTYRSLALGDFRDLLHACVFSPAMRYYLHLVDSQCRGANEDFGREALELHTVGPYKVGDPSTPNYTTTDIQFVSEVFRGLDVDRALGVPDWGQALGWWCHWNHPVVGPPLLNKQLFTGAGQTHMTPWAWTNVNPPTLIDWQRELDDVLDNLAQQQQTKEFVCSKLIRWFVGDRKTDVDPNLLAHCVNAWGTRGDISKVLTVIFLSSEFRSSNLGDRLKNPLETMVSIARAFGAGFADANGQPNVANRTELLQRLTAILDGCSAAGITPHEHPAPDGYPLRSQRQVGSGVFWELGTYAFRIYSDHFGLTNPTENLIYDPVAAVQAEVTRLNFDWNNSRHVATAGLAMLFDRRFSTLDRTHAMNFLNSPTPWPGSSNPTESADRVRLLAAFLCTLPQIQEK